MQVIASLVTMCLVIASASSARADEIVQVAQDDPAADLPALSANGKTIALPIFSDEDFTAFVRTVEVVFAPLGKADGKRFLMGKKIRMGKGTNVVAASVDAVNAELAKGKYRSTGFNTFSGTWASATGHELEADGRATATLTLKLRKQGKQVSKLELKGTKLDALLVVEAGAYLYVQVRDELAGGTRTSWHPIKYR